MSLKVPIELNTAQLLSWYQAKSLETQQQLVLRVLNIFADRHDIHAMNQVYSNVAVGLDTSSGIIKIRYFLIGHDPVAARDVYDSMISNGCHRKRCLELLMDYYLVDSLQPSTQTALDLQLAYGYLYPAENSDLTRFLPYSKVVSLQPLLERFVGLPIMLPSTTERTLFPTADGFIGSYKLQKISFNQVDMLLVQQAILEIFNKKQCRHQLHCEERLNKILNYRFVIDGANVLYFKDRMLTANSSRRLNDVINGIRSATGVNASEIVVVLHEKYERQCFPKGTGVQLCTTPPGLDDDYFSLYLATRFPNVMLVSNDQFRDHIHNLSQCLHQWRREMVIEYEYGADMAYGVQLKWPKAWSCRIQHQKSTFYVPVEGMAQASPWLVIDCPVAEL